MIGLLLLLYYDYSIVKKLPKSCMYIIDCYKETFKKREIINIIELIHNENYYVRFNTSYLV